MVLLRLFNGPYAMVGYEVTAESEQPMMFRICSSAEASAVCSTILNEVGCQCVEFRVNRVLMVSYKVSAAIVMEMCSSSEF
ncbi:unnamed protein product [Larinioides sclopetarius]|uniref:Uncharacterized protein n=1 Tax=Larinioides sclopetarius TaxID=280406 RepID=A0AAV1Z7E1_9ARAC